MPKKKPSKKSKKKTLVQRVLPFPLICDRCGKKLKDRKQVACGKCLKEAAKT